MRRQNAFSLVEVTLAIGVIGFALLAILGMVPVGTRSGRDSVDATRTSLIAQTVFNRVRATMQSNDPASPAYFNPYAAGTFSYFFFTSEGLATGELLKVSAAGDQPQFYPNVKTASDFYRAKVKVAAFDQTVAYDDSDPRKIPAAGTTPNLLCATIEIGWPLNTQDGSIISGTANGAKATYTFSLRKP